MESENIAIEDVKFGRDGAPSAVSIGKQLAALQERSLAVNGKELKLVCTEERKRAKIWALRDRGPVAAARTVPPKDRFEELIDLSLEFLTKPWNIYENGSLLLKQTVLRLVFSEPLRYSRECRYRTTETAPPFKVLAGFNNQNIEMVRSRRLELPRVLPHSDLNAARLPIPPRPHCLGLVRGRIAKGLRDVKRECALRTGNLRPAKAHEKGRGHRGARPSLFRSLPCGLL